MRPATMARDRFGQLKLPGKWKPQVQDAIAILAISGPLCYLIWRRGGVEPADQVLAFGCVLGLTALACLLGNRLGLQVTILCPVAAVASLPVLQLLPVDLASWGLASPSSLRATGQLRGLGVDPFEAVSIYPFATLQAVTVVAGCCAVFVIARAIGRHAERAVLVAVAPVLLASLVEAALGLHQYLRGQLFGDVLSPMAHGTFINRNHFAALLGSCFGLVVGLSVVSGFGLGRARPARSRDMVLTLVGAGVAVAYLVGIVLSFSRMGIVVAVLLALASVLMAAWCRGPSLLLAGSCATAIGITAAVGVAGLAIGFSGSFRTRATRAAWPSGGTVWTWRKTTCGRGRVWDLSLLYSGARRCTFRVRPWTTRTATIWSGSSSWDCPQFYCWQALLA